MQIEGASNFDGVPIDKVRALYGGLTKARCGQARGVIDPSITDGSDALAVTGEAMVPTSAASPK